MAMTYTDIYTGVKETIRFLIHTAEQQFSEPKQGPAKKAFVLALIRKGLETRLSGFWLDIVIGIVSSLIDGEASKMFNKDGKELGN